MVLYDPVARMVLVGHGFLEPVQIEVLQGVEDLAPAPGGEVAVTVDQQGDVRTDRVADRFHAGDAFARVGSPVDAVRHPVEGGQLHGVEPIRHGGGRVPGEPRGRPVGGRPVDVGVEGYRVVAPAPDEVRHGRAQHLALDVPQGLVEGAQGPHFRPVDGRREEFGQDALDAAGIAAGQHGFGLMQEVHAPGPGASGIHFAETGDAFVGMHRQERPVSPVIHVDGVGLQSGYLHGMASCRTRRRRTDLTLYSLIDHGNAFVYITP